MKQKFKEWLPAIKKLREEGKSLRQIAALMKIHRNTLKRLLAEEGKTARRRNPKASLLDPFREQIRSLSEKPEMTNRLIFLEIRKSGYQGGKTILGDYLRSLRRQTLRQKAFIRYEPDMGMEAQMDWSPYTIQAGKDRIKIHIFSMVLSWSRYLYSEAFTDERQDTLFQGHIEAFQFFDGIPARILYDNQSPVVAGRIGKKAFLQPRFERFAKHYGFEPKICIPGYPQRKGRVERPFGYLETSFFPGRVFKSLEDLRGQLKAWMRDGQDETGNCRIHGTTRKRPVDMFQEERKVLIRLPETDFLPTRIEERMVGKDCLISVMGNRYSVPPVVVGKKVTVVMTPKKLCIHNQNREQIAVHDIAHGKGKMVINDAHYASLRKERSKETLTDMDRRFLDLFPEQASFLDAVKQEMKSVYPIHLKQIFSLLEPFTLDQVNRALCEACAHGIPQAGYVKSVLKRWYPSQVFRITENDIPAGPLGTLELGPLEIGNTSTFDAVFTPGRGKGEREQ